MQLEFKIREAVWAKVQEHPWWPGKIVKVLKEDEKTVYKVSFFADPSYSFLLPHHLRPLDQPPLAPHPTHPQLRNALRMAHAHAHRLAASTHLDTLDAAELPLLDSSQEQKTEEMLLQNIVIPQERVQAEEEQTPRAESVGVAACVSGEITAENVLEMIEQNRRRQKMSGYSYETRKEEMQLQAELKRNLLLRFNLHAFDAPPATLPTPAPRRIIQITPENITSRSYRRICKAKSKGGLLQGEIEMLRRRCIRKVTALLQNPHQQHPEPTPSPKSQAVRIIKRILLLAEDNRIKLQSLFVTLVKALAGSSPVSTVEDRLAEFGNYLEQLETDKQEDQGSKITQIQV